MNTKNESITIVEQKSIQATAQKKSVCPYRKEPGCEACGNPAYPYCKDSCPLFD